MPDAQSAEVPNGNHACFGQNTKLRNTLCLTLQRCALILILVPAILSRCLCAQAVLVVSCSSVSAGVWMPVLPIYGQRATSEQCTGLSYRNTALPTHSNRTVHQNDLKVPIFSNLLTDLPSRRSLCAGPATRPSTIAVQAPQ